MTMMLVKNYYSLFHLYFLINILFILSINGKDYCSINCIDAKINDSIFHIKCLRPDCELSGPCKRSPEEWVGLTGEEKQTILDLHNDLRNSLALGNMPNKPAAKNMYKLQWDDEVADIAQCWANACVMTHDFGCRDVGGYKVGQNMGMEAPYIEDVSIENLITFWFQEAGSYNFTDTFQGQEKTNGHFTQMGWATTKYLGCGKIIYHDDKYNLDTLHLVCNYMPEGNIIGESMYIPGEPQTACPPNSVRDKIMTGLCVETQQRHERRMFDSNIKTNNNTHAEYDQKKRIGHKSQSSMKKEERLVAPNNEKIVNKENKENKINPRKAAVVANGTEATNGAEHSTARVHGFVIVLLCLPILNLIL